MLVIAAFPALPSPIHAAEDARQRIIEEACPGFEREEKGANGVMSPREVRCRLAVGQSYAEIDQDIKARQRELALEQQRAEKRTELAQERATQGRQAAQRAAPELCQAMLAEHRAGRWFTSSSTAVSLLRDEAAAGRGIDAAALASVTAVMDGLGHNYAEPDQRALALQGRTPEDFQAFDAFIQHVGMIGLEIRARARRAQAYEDSGRNAPGPVASPPDATSYAFACFLVQQFGSVQADPFDRAVKRDAAGRYIGTR